jgi:lipopolysaccharide transport system permease protein
LTDRGRQHVVQPSKGLLALRLTEWGHFRELLYFLTWRDIKVRYKQTLLGIFWAVLQPVLTMILFSLVFGQVAKISSGGVPYPIFSYAALVPWTFFANAIQQSSLNVTLNPALVTKIYFPRVFLVTGPILACLVDFALAFVVLIGLMIYYGIGPNLVGAVLLVPLLLLAFVAAFGVGAWLAALNVKYRDVRFVVPFLMQVWMFATPVVYSTASLPATWRAVYGINPMAAVVEGFRWALAGGPRPSGLTVLLSVISGLLMFLGGLLYFNRAEKKFADVI